MISRSARAARFAAALTVAPLALSVVIAPPATAQLIVYDPTNYAQNLLSATRALQQINNQITSLQNQAQMLVRSEEHTSELQSLMRISYAVFCLKKKIKKPNQHNTFNITTRKK